MANFYRTLGIKLLCGITLAALMCFTAVGCNNDPDNSRAFTGLVITSLPEKTVYDFDEELDLSGLAVSARYSDGSAEAVTDYDLDTSEFDPSFEGNYTITLSYEGKQASFCVGVYPVSVYPNFEMVLINGDSFLMGSPCNEAERRDTNEGICDCASCLENGHASCPNPTCTQRLVTVSDFFIGKYQVTQAEYRAVMGSNPSYFHGGAGREPASGEVQGRRPVEMVNWYEAIEFCNTLSELNGL